MRAIHPHGLVSRVRAVVGSVIVASAAMAGALTFQTTVAEALPPTPLAAFDSIGSNVPGNVSSLGFEATSTNEVGDFVRLAPGPRQLSSVTVTMSSWACGSGAWTTSCVTVPGTTFSHDLTLTVYAASGPATNPVVGSVLATKTQTFNIPFRPSSDDGTHCSGGPWWDPITAKCYSGLATPVTFTFPAGTILPSQVIWTISYNTSHHGYSPIGEATCYPNCGYDSLNVGLRNLPPPVTAGTDLDPSGFLHAGTSTGSFCSGTADGTLRADSPCWGSYRLMARIDTNEVTATSGTTVVTSAQLNNWTFVQENTSTTTVVPPTFVSGPATPPLGSGSASLTVPDSANGMAIVNPEFSGTKLANLTALDYSTYQPGPTLATSLGFDVRYRTTDTQYGGRLVYEPYLNVTPPVPSGWQRWSTLTGRWWASKTNVQGTNGPCGQSSPCTWAEILANWPDAEIHGNVVLKAGSGWLAGSSVGVDALTVGYDDSAGHITEKTFDFENRCTAVCYVNAATGNDLNTGLTPTDALKTIGAGTAAVASGGTVNVAAGDYVEDVDVTKSMTLQGAGAATTTVSGPIGGGFATIYVTAPNVVIDGFGITRLGNTTAQWVGALNTAGIGVYATGVEIRNSTLTRNRTAINVVNGSGASIHNNVIDDNRTGVFFWNVNDNVSMTQNDITDNWALGVLFFSDPGVSSNANSVFTDNNISGNWYGQIVDRQSPTNIKNFSGNYLGTSSPIVTTNDSAEPAYTDQIPVEFGGTAVKPVGQPDIVGPSSASIDFTPMLDIGDDTDLLTPGFQGNTASVTVTTNGAQSGTAERIQEGVDLVSAAGTVHVGAGTYPETTPIVITKSLRLLGPNAGLSPNNTSAPILPSLLRVPEATITVPGANDAIDIGAAAVIVDGFRFTDSATTGTSNATFIGAGQSFGGPAPQVVVRNNVFDGITRVAVTFNGTTSMDGGTVNNNRVNSPTRATGCGTSPAAVPAACGRPLFNLWQTDHLSFQRNVVISNPGTAGDGFQVLNVDFPNGPSLQDDSPAANITIAHNTVRYACSFNCFTLGGSTTNVEIFNNDALIAEGSVIGFNSSWTAGRVDVTHNALLDSGTFAVAVANPAADLDDVTVNRNAIGGLGIKNISSDDFDARCNWWGEASGPLTGQNSGAVTVMPVLPTANVNGMCDAPISVSGVAGNTQVTVSWSAPPTNDGDPITAYTVTSAPGAKTCTTAGTLTCVVTGLTNGVAYTFTVTASNAGNTGPPSAPSGPVTPLGPVVQTATPADYNPVGPKRVFDTRPGESPDSLRHILQQKVGGESSILDVQFTALGVYVPATGVGAVSINVTVTNPTASGFVTVYDCGTRPFVSSVNFVAGQTVANAVISPLSAAGHVCFYSTSPVDIVADVNGWFTAGRAFTPVSPRRVFDTRPGESPEAARDVARQQVGGDTNILEVKVTGIAGITPSSGVGAVSLNVTIDDPTGPGYVTVFPCGGREVVSSVNYIAHQTVANAVIAPVSANGTVCFFSTASTHIVVDINGWLQAVSGYTAIVPKRVFDTRPNESANSIRVVDKAQIGGVKELEVKFSNMPGIVPATGVSSVSINVTATNPQGPGFVTVYACGTRELVSSVNFARGQTVPNAVITPLSATGSVCFYSSQNTDIVVDVNGWFATV